MASMRFSPPIAGTKCGPDLNKKRTASCDKRLAAFHSMGHLRFQEARKFPGTIVEARENCVQTSVAQMAADKFSEDRAEIGGEREVAAFVQLARTEARPFAINFSALYRAAHHEHAVGVAVIGAAISVFVGGASEFGHGHNDNIFHTIAQILVERGQPLSHVA